MTKTATRTEPRIDRIVRVFLSSEYFSAYQAERIESGGYARSGSDDRDRFDRCYDAAEDGADGSTHREAIADMRGGFRAWLSDRRRSSRLHFAEYPYRLEAAACDYFDRLEQWHTDNGSIDQVIG